MRLINYTYNNKKPKIYDRASFQVSSSKNVLMLSHNCCIKNMFYSNSFYGNKYPNATNALLDYYKKENLFVALMEMI